MSETGRNRKGAAAETVKVLARSPGRFPVLVVESPSGELLTTHFETRYDLALGKSVEADWVRENAVGRHSFIEVDPPETLAPDELYNYATEHASG